MKTIGLLGGMSWESTALYYELINKAISERIGGLHAAKITMVSVDFGEIDAIQKEQGWDAVGVTLSKVAQQIEAGGADFLLLCTNTMHIVAPQIQAAIDIPLLHIADATAGSIKQAGMKTVGLLGTNFTMEQEFYRARLVEHGLNVLIPPKHDRDIIHRVIYDELCLGLTKDASRSEYLRIMDNLCAQGAEGIIEGCTEIGMLVKPEHTDIPLFDTTIVHAKAAVREALK